MKKLAILSIILFFAFSNIYAQKPQKLSSNQIYEKIQKLNFLGSVLYIAAHPDDENTRLISYLSNHVKANTTYLSLTRGDGGQNLIGPEIRESLGVIRTQELLAARSVDGGSQLFSRANDFGYSKHPDETFEIWDKDQVLSDVVWAIRTVKPDVIINRFDHRTPGTTHGHHTASAILSEKAFDLAADKTQFSSQLEHIGIWQAKRLFFNTNWWFYGSKKLFDQTDKTKLSKVDIGVYYPTKGLSNNEIAAIASSQHLCQGFGRLTQRGSQDEYLEFLKGDEPKDKTNLFEGVNTTWTRVKGGKKIQKILKRIESDFNFRNPSEHLTELMKAYQLISNLENTHWKIIKQKEIADIIMACAGLYLEASSKTATTNPDGKVGLKLEVLNRSTATISLESIVLFPEGKEISKGKVLENNKKLTFEEIISLKNESYTNPYWLNKEGSIGMYTVENQLFIGKPETPKEIKVVFNLNINGKPIEITKDVVYRFSKRDKGELYQPFEVVPKVTTKIQEKVIIFEGEEPKTVRVHVRAGKNNTKGKVELCHPNDWKISPKSKEFSIEQKGDEILVDFKVFPPSKQSEGKISGLITVDGEQYSKELVEIAYDHIPKQTILSPAVSKVVRLNIKKKGTKIGYIQGAGDVVPENLRQIGYTVDELNISAVDLEILKKYDAIVLGIRAYNTLEELKFKQKFLLEYVNEGGTMVVQYNTGGRRPVDVKAPYLLNVSRDRVTDEFAKVTFLVENHPVLNTPNKITQKDFEGWVQERGLYFPNKWGKEFTPVFSMHDKGEQPKKGSLLIAKYGKGYYVYTGLSFFRELPAGVPGAYKLFANILSIGK